MAYEQWTINYNLPGPYQVIVLNPNEGVTITKAVMHRPRAEHRTVMLMVETTGIIPTGD